MLGREAHEPFPSFGGPSQRGSHSLHPRGVRRDHDIRPPATTAGRATARARARAGPAAESSGSSSGGSSGSSSGGGTCMLASATPTGTAPCELVYALAGDISGCNPSSTNQLTPAQCMALCPPTTMYTGSVAGCSVNGGNGAPPTLNCRYSGCSTGRRPEGLAPLAPSARGRRGGAGQARRGSALPQRDDRDRARRGAARAAFVGGGGVARRAARRRRASAREGRARACRRRLAARDGRGAGRRARAPAGCADGHRGAGHGAVAARGALVVKPPRHRRSDDENGPFPATHQRNPMLRIGSRVLWLRVVAFGAILTLASAPGCGGQTSSGNGRNPSDAALPDAPQAADAAEEASTERDSAVDGKGPGCGCAAGTICIGTRTIGGGQGIPPDDAGACPPGLHPEGGICTPDYSYVCMAPPATCPASIQCACAGAGYCPSGETCIDRSSLPPNSGLSPNAVLVCELDAP